MIILGIDPGLATVGYGVIEYTDNKEIKLIDYGIISTKANVPFVKRLKLLYDGMTELIDQFNPDAVAFEELFFNKNVTTAIDVAHARGVLLLSAFNKITDLYEYTPLQVKQAITGYGRAEKNQMQQMVKIICKIKEVPRPDDAADAVAIAICHAQYSGVFSEQNKLKGL